MASALLPDLIRPVVISYLEGRREEAAKLYARILPLINYENRQCGLRATKAMMAEGGVMGAIGAISNAASDALSHLGIVADQQPLSPMYLHGLIQKAQALQQQRTPS